MASSPVRVVRPRSLKSKSNLDNENYGRFNDQVVIITGGASGIGQSCALRFAREGAFVYLFDITRP